VTKLLEVLPASAAIVAVIGFPTYWLLRVPLAASVGHRVSARTRWKYFGLACAYAAAFLIAIAIGCAMMLVIRPLTNEHEQRADADHNTAEQPDRTAAKDRLIKLKLTIEQHDRTAPGGNS
jgi:hypothetical protein